MFEHLDDADLTWQEFIQVFVGASRFWIILAATLEVTFGVGQLHDGVGTLADSSGCGSRGLPVSDAALRRLIVCPASPSSSADCHALSLLWFCIAILSVGRRAAVGGLLIFRSTVLVIFMSVLRIPTNYHCCQLRLLLANDRLLLRARSYGTWLIVTNND